MALFTNLKSSLPKSWQRLNETFVKTSKQFRSAEQGSLLPMVAASLIVLTGSAGLAIDGARMFYVKDVLQKSLDSAGLAAGHAMEVDDMEADAQEFFDANINSVSQWLTNSEMVAQISDDNSTVTLTANATISASFTALFGYDEITLSASTEITRETRGMELVIVMDNTGSMRWSGKIDAAKDAAAQLVETVYGDEDTNNNLWVGVVPYIAHVNIGSSHESWLTDAGKAKIDDGDFLPTEWMGCVMARSDGEDLTDTPPSEAPFEPWYWNDEPDYDSSWRPNDWIDDDSDRTVYEANSRSSAKGPNRGCGQEVLGLVESKTTVLASIDEMEAWSFGGTASPTGLVWGWRVLSEKWQGLWGGDTPADLPLANDTAYMDKVMVILTDGKNEFISRNDLLGGSDFTAYGTIDDWGFDSIYDARDELDDRFADICNNIKDDDIIIYGITFGSTPDTATKDAFETCATDPAYYFHAPSNSELEEVFEAIGRQLSNLRLSQ
jgi:Flp pilus assembly protein TadG